MGMITIIINIKGFINMKRMNKRFLILILIFLQSCSLAPGMNMNKSFSLSGQDKVFLDGKDEPIIIEKITPELIQKEKSRSEVTLPNDLLKFMPAEYRIGSGDILAITVWGPEELFPRNLQVKGNPLIERVVRADGTIFYPYVGQVKVSGKTREEVRKNISTELKKSFIEIQVDVSLAAYNSQKVVLSGAFVRPGNLNLNEVPLTLTQAISLGGSTLGNADLSNLKLSRGDKDYLLDYEYHTRTSGAVHNIYLRDSDVIHIPFNDEKKVYVVGEVVRSSTIDLRRSSMRLSDAISRAGGLYNQTADGSQVYIIRNLDNYENARIFQINLKSPSGFILASEFYLEPQDIVFVGPASIARWNRVIAQFFPFTSFLNAVDNLQSND